MDNWTMINDIIDTTTLNAMLKALRAAKLPVKSSDDEHKLEMIDLNTGKLRTIFLAQSRAGGWRVTFPQELFA